jgi:hypothetical protein
MRSVNQAGSGSINGHPIFFSMRVLDAEDSDRLQTALREAEKCKKLHEKLSLCPPPLYIA